jgi:hypothetical protein
MGTSIGVWTARAIKILALAAGAPLAVLAAMAIAGTFVVNGWGRLGIALAVVIGVPALIADRLLPDDPDRARGLPTDIFAVAWLGLAFAVFGAGIGVTRSMVQTEAERLARADYPRMARAATWLAGHRAEAAAVAPGELSAEGERDAGATEVADDVAEPEPATGGDDEPEGPMTAARLFARWAPSVITIQTSAGPLAAGGGTGFFIGGDGTAVTNHHVIEGAKDVRVKLKDGRWAEKVELLLDAPEHDIAVLRITPADDVDPTRLGDSDTIAVGDAVISIGNPLGLEHTLTDGLISARRKIGGKKMIQMSAPVSPGNSGGPLFNMRGEVIGVTTAQMRGFGAQNLNLAVPINTVKELLQDSYPDAKVIGGGGPEMGTW